jgi:hypothetical protein
MSRLRTEVVALAGVVQAAISLAASFGFHLSGEQVGAINIFALAVLGLFVRSKVAPVSKGS